MKMTKKKPTETGYYRLKEKNSQDYPSHIVFVYRAIENEKEVFYGKLYGEFQNINILEEDAFWSEKIERPEDPE